MGGTITVGSEPGKGTVFTIRLNLKDRKPAEQPKAA
jgi:signal transduction histidine kinase